MYVVPAKAGTHTPCFLEKLRSMGPGPRFRSAGTTAESYPGNKSAKANPSRSTVSPTFTAILRESIGPAETKE